MAAHGSPTGGNAKLDAFLRRSFDPRQYDRVLATHKCIVDKNFSFVILTDDCVYLTENPPRVIQPAVQLKDIVSIRLVSTVQVSTIQMSTVQVFTIQVSTVQVFTIQMSTVKVSTVQMSTVQVSTVQVSTVQVSTLQVSTVQVSTTQVSTVQTSTIQVSTIQVSTVNVSTILVSTVQVSTVQVSTIQVSTVQINDFPEFLGGDQQAETQHICIRHGAQPSTPSIPSSPSTPLRSPHQLSVPDPFELSENSPKKEKKARRTSSKLSVSFNEASLQAAKREAERDVPKKAKLSHSLPTSQLRDLTLEKEEIEQQQRRVGSAGGRDSRPLPTAPPSPNNTKNSNNSRRPLPPPLGLDKGDHRQSSSLRAPGRRRSSSKNSEAASASTNTGSSRSLGSDSSDGSEDWDSWDEELHLYMLSAESPMLMQLRSAWNAHLIHATNDLNEDSPQGTSTAAGTGSKQLELLFQQLKRELLGDDSGIELVFSLLQELNTAAQRYFTLKKLFWKSGDLFQFLIKQLQKHLPGTTPLGHGQRNNRADELELSIQVAETLCTMFRGTTVLPSRVVVLNSTRGKHLRNLLEMLVCSPGGIRARSPRTQALRTSLNIQHPEDPEVQSLIRHYSEVATSVLFEIILIAHEAGSGDSDSNMLNLTWVLLVLENMQQSVSFINVLVASAMRLLSPSTPLPLSPSQAILVFQQFYLLSTFIQYGSSLANHIRDNFTEEFRYFITWPVVQEKLPMYYPISRLAQKLIRQVTIFVQQKHR
ncbi:C12orf56 [Branchiostoma lanceolatum]|uniref:C12orf56 protein n=1 Tax=Branchiostoma lanceolatum TaxID=7740 RepID=A0A8K0ETY4_BRALA|nr:C12orf56 [Branchiostoma lanceolatum]